MNNEIILMCNAMKQKNNIFIRENNLLLLICAGNFERVENKLIKFTARDINQKYIFKCLHFQFK